MENTRLAMLLFLQCPSSGPLPNISSTRQAVNSTDQDVSVGKRKICQYLHRQPLWFGSGT